MIGLRTLFITGSLMACSQGAPKIDYQRELLVTSASLIVDEYPQREYDVCSSNTEQLIYMGQRGTEWEQRPNIAKKAEALLSCVCMQREDEELFETLSRGAALVGSKEKRISLVQALVQNIDKTQSCYEKEAKWFDGRAKSILDIRLKAGGL